jgi:hypothetical protein
MCSHSSCAECIYFQIMPNLTLDDAARFLSDAWDAIPGSTIRHCWRHAGIVPDVFIEEMKLLDDVEEEGTEEVIIEIQSQIAELRKQRQEVLDDPASAIDYVNIDDAEVCLSRVSRTNPSFLLLFLT